MKMSDRYAEIPLTECPQCGHRINAASTLSDDGRFAHPHAGDTTVCMDCGAWLVFRDDLSMRLMTADEKVGLEELERQALVQLSRAIEKVHKIADDGSKLR